VERAFGPADDSVNSIVLITNGLSFAFQAVIFLIVGSFADYGVWRPHITTGFTILGWGVSFGWLGVMTPDKYVSYLTIRGDANRRWQVGTALYILGLISYQGALTCKVLQA
jgi:MFS-type transporter involved in bile tolerance (Atg22 family)